LQDSTSEDEGTEVGREREPAPAAAAAAAPRQVRRAGGGIDAFFGSNAAASGAVRGPSAADHLSAPRGVAARRRR
jgi:hypothetical protein